MLSTNRFSCRYLFICLFSLNIFHIAYWSGVPKVVGCQLLSYRQTVSKCIALYSFGYCRYDKQGEHVVLAAHSLHILSPRPAHGIGHSGLKRDAAFISRDKRMPTIPKAVVTEDASLNKKAYKLEMFVDKI